MFNDAKTKEKIIASRDNAEHIKKRCESANKLRKEIRQKKILEDLISRGKKRQQHK